MEPPTEGPTEAPTSPAEQNEPYPGYFAGAEPPDLGCRLPPEGWWCSIEPGHDGPCAARPKPDVMSFDEFMRTPFHRFEPQMPRYKAPKSDLVDSLAYYVSGLEVKRRSDSILLLFRPRPWWLPPILHGFLMRRLTTVVMYDSQVPLSLGPVRMEPFYRDHVGWADIRGGAKHPSAFFDGWLG